MYIFISTTIGFMFFVLLRSSLTLFFLLKSTTGMHNVMANKVIRSVIVFFDSNPLGRIVTRFAKDMTIIDILIAPILIWVTQGVLRAVSVIITVSIINPYLLIFAAFGLAYMLYVTKLALRSMVDAQRFEQMFYGPINQTLSMVI